MSKSARLRLPDLRAISQLTHECRDLGDDPVAWREHCFAGVAKLVGADLVAGGELAGVRAGRQRELGSVAWGWENGFNPAGWQRALELLATDPNYSSQMVEYAKRLVEVGEVVFRGSDLAEEREFLRGAEYQEVYRTIGTHHAMWCTRFIPRAPDETDGGVFMRAEGRPDYSARDKAIVHETYALIAPMVGGALARFAEPSPSALPPRVRQVLLCLLEGDGDKQIAVRLKLSAHTVNEYVKRVYAHFGVVSRTELLARWVRRGWGANGPGWAEPT
jgi:DNA-binding CsgD family transcriptional regulator